MSERPDQSACLRRRATTGTPSISSSSSAAPGPARPRSTLRARLGGATDALVLSAVMRLVLEVGRLDLVVDVVASWTWVGNLSGTVDTVERAVDNAGLGIPEVPLDPACRLVVPLFWTGRGGLRLAPSRSVSASSLAFRLRGETFRATVATFADPPRSP